MFTGIIEEVGVIREILTNLDGLEIEIDASLVLSDLKVNDSISCSGICLTVTMLEKKSFKVQLVQETLKKNKCKKLGSWLFYQFRKSIITYIENGRPYCTGSYRYSSKN